MGLIADVALLKGETRSLAQKGIEALRNTNRLGLKVIAELSGTNLETLTEETIGFTFAPRLNALGRLGDANPAVELLLTQDPARARVLAAQIEGLNVQRRLLTSQVYEAAEAQLRANPDLLTEPAIVLSNRSWPGGVVGIVANKLVDRYHKPAILLNESEDGILRGSARSIEGLHITEAIATQKDILRGFGGHPMAAGMSLLKDDLISFRKGLGKAIEKQLGEIVREEPTLQIDAWLGLNEINISPGRIIGNARALRSGKSIVDFGFARRDVEIRFNDWKNKRTSALDISKMKAGIRKAFYGGAAQAKNFLPRRRTTNLILPIPCAPAVSADRNKSHCNLKNSEWLKKNQLKSRKAKLEIMDFRLNVVSLQPSILRTLVWAEGADKSKGKSRFELHPSR